MFGAERMAGTVESGDLALPGPGLVAHADLIEAGVTACVASDTETATRSSEAAGPHDVDPIEPADAVRLNSDEIGDPDSSAQRASRRSREVRAEIVQSTLQSITNFSADTLYGTGVSTS